MDDGRCGPLYAGYVAARAGDLETLRASWPAVEPVADEVDGVVAGKLDAAIAAGDVETARAHAAELVFRDADPPALDGPLAGLVGGLLHGFGYVASVVLFLLASSPVAVVGRLRWAYRTVGVTVVDVESVDGTERTVFRCPYRDVGASRYGQRRVCHDVLDRVDDGYVTFLARHRGLAYDRPRPCAGGECCYSEVAER